MSIVMSVFICYHVIIFCYSNNLTLTLTLTITITVTVTITSDVDVDDSLTRLRSSSRVVVVLSSGRWLQILVWLLSSSDTKASVRRGWWI